MKPARKTAALKAIARTWTPFVQTALTPELRTQYPLLRHCHSLYSNSRLEVQCFACETEIGGVMQVSICRHGQIEDVTGDDMRRVLLELFGPETTAVEVYSPMDEKWRVRVLWILPGTFNLPFGLQLKTAWGRPA